MTFRRRVATSVLLLGIGACALSVSGEPEGGVSLAPSAHAQGFIRNLIARLRGRRCLTESPSRTGALRRPRSTSPRNMPGGSPR